MSARRSVLRRLGVSEKGLKLLFSGAADLRVTGLGQVGGGSAAITLEKNGLAEFVKVDGVGYRVLSNAGKLKAAEARRLGL